MAFTIDRVELERLAQFAVSLYVGCNSVERSTRPVTVWEPLISAIDRFSADFIREDVMRGDLKAAAETLLDPWSRCCCGVRFLAQVENYLDPADVRELQARWEQAAVDFDEELRKPGIDLNNED
jgi:hypothetical protein